MAIEAKHFLDGVQIRPQNAKDIGFRLNFNPDSEGNTTSELSVDSIILVNEAKKLVLDHIVKYGVFQGIPYTVDIDSVVFEYFVDLTKTPNLSGDGDGSIEVKIFQRKSWTQFKEKADDLSFEAINKTHEITTKDADYIIVRDNQGMLFITSLLTTYVLVDATVDAVLKLAKSAGELAAVVLPATGAVTTTVTGAAGPYPVIAAGVGTAVSYSAGQIAWMVIKAVLRLAYLALVVIALINVINQLVQVVFPRVRSLKASTILELINKGCEKLGYTFESTILEGNYKPLTLLPIPLAETKKSIFLETLLPSFQSGYTKGYPTAQDTTPTLGSLIDAMITMFNGKIFVNNGVVTLERRDFLLQISNRKVTNTLNVQDERKNEYTFNTGDAWKRYLVKYQIDHSDIHTVDNFKGVSAEYSTEPIVVPHDDLVLIKGLSTPEIPFAHGVRKGDFTWVEGIIYELALNVDKFTGGSSASSIAARKSAIKISEQYYSVTKLLYAAGSKQGSTYLDSIGADVIYRDFHQINEVKPNFKRIYNSPVPFSSQDFVELQGNNYFYDTEGELLELFSMDWNNGSKTAEIEYAVSSDEANNIKTIKISG
jgi:hypothetical protein